MPAHRLPPDTIPDGEHVGPAARDAQWPDPRGVAGAVPQRVQHEAGQHGREQDDEVPQPDLARKKGQHDDGDHGPEKGEKGGVGVVQESGDVAEPGRNPHGYRPQPPGEYDADIPRAPAVLLPHERVEIVRADPCRQQNRQVDNGPADSAHIEPGVHVFGVGNQRWAAVGFKRGSPVNCGRTAAHGRVQPVAGHLDRPVEHFLDRPCCLFDPGLRGAAPEILRGLHDRDRGIVQVRKGLGEEVPPRSEIRVQDDQVFGIGPGEGVPQVASLLAGGPVGSVDIAEAEGLGHQAGLTGRSVVKDIGPRTAGVFLDEVSDGGPGVAEQFDRLAADGQVDIHVGISGRAPGPDPRLMNGEVEPVAGEIQRQAYRLVDDVRGGEKQERRQHQVVQFEAQLASDQAARADEDHGRQVGQVPPDVEVFLVVVRGMRRHQATLLVRFARGGNRFRDHSGDGVHLLAHDRRWYCQITQVPGAGPAGPGP